jgi:hypothetical protein
MHRPARPHLYADLSLPQHLGTGCASGKHSCGRRLTLIWARGSSSSWTSHTCPAAHSSPVCAVSMRRYTSMLRYSADALVLFCAMNRFLTRTTTTWGSSPGQWCADNRQGLALPKDNALPENVYQWGHFPVLLEVRVNSVELSTDSLPREMSSLHQMRFKFVLRLTRVMFLTRAAVTQTKPK